MTGRAYLPSPLFLFAGKWLHINFYTVIWGKRKSEGVGVEED